MKTSDIQVGKTYCNRGKGKTKRTVLAIGYEHMPCVQEEDAGLKSYKEPGVLYEQLDRYSGGKAELVKYALSRSSFAAWAGKEVKE